MTCDLWIVVTVPRSTVMRRITVRVNGIAAGGVFVHITPEMTDADFIAKAAKKAFKRQPERAAAVEPARAMWNVLRQTIFARQQRRCRWRAVDGGWLASESWWIRLCSGGMCRHVYGSVFVVVLL